MTKKLLILSLAVAFAASLVVTPTRAQQLIASYTALLSDADHFNSRGQRLTTAAAIIRQNRANFHRFGIRSPEDQDDPFFADEANRAALEQMLSRGRADPGVIERIVNGPPVLVRVDIFRDSSGPFIRVTLLNNPQPAQQPELPTRFLGEWIDAGDNQMKMTVAADRIFFGTSQPACKFTNITVANEDGSAYEVNWHCPDSAASVEIKMAFRVMKVWGKGVLVLVNREEPTVVSVYGRAH